MASRQLPPWVNHLIGCQRTPAGNRHLGLLLAGLAGTINSAGFLAVSHFTAHMTGIVATIASALAQGSLALLLPALAALLSFVLGALGATLLVRLARRSGACSEYAYPLLLEGMLLGGFALWGDGLERHFTGFITLTLLLLGFVMGLQNAVMTQLSRAEIRVTHLTGIITDIGIELGKFATPHPAEPQNRQKLDTLLLLAGCFCLGGVAGIMGFNRAGYLIFAAPALLLCVLSAAPVRADLCRAGTG